jgi:hypothetical protein
VRAPSIFAYLVLLAAVLVIGAAPACVGSVEISESGDGVPDPFGASALCRGDYDCVLAGATCCACPTFAVLNQDPVARACSNVTGKPDCPPPSCSENVFARCNDEQRCELACKPRACEPTASCAYGFAADANGCLTCECATPEAGGCTVNADCVQTRADCCGCAQGGKDTAVLVNKRPSYDAMLNCPSMPFCPGINTCTADVPTCVQGRCELVSPYLPVGACGRPDLAACPAGTQCLVNVSDQANMHGVGVCGEPL